MAPVRLVVAQVRGLHGLNGAVRVEVLTDRPVDRFAAGNVLHVEGDARPLTIATAEPVEDGPGWRLRFREAANRDAAEWLRDAYLEIAVDRATDLVAGAAYWHEVIGAVVRNAAGMELGRVADVYRVGENEVYVVRGGPPGEFDMPAVRDVITEFAPERGEIVVDEAVLDLGGAVVDAPEKTAGAKPRRRPRWSRHGKGAKGADDAGDAAGNAGDAAGDAADAGDQAGGAAGPEA